MDDLADFLAEAASHVTAIEAALLREDVMARAEAHRRLTVLGRAALAHGLVRTARLAAAIETLMGRGPEAHILLLRGLMRLRDVLGDCLHGVEPAGEDSDIVSAAEGDRLPSIADTLALARERLLEISPAGRDPRLDALLNQLSSLGEELHEEETRPIAECYSALGALVETAAKANGKRVALIMEGDVRIPLAAVAPLREALTHLVRNACAHGVEPPAERRAVGKTETGRIRVSAARLESCAIIDVIDDGRGVDTRGLRLRAVANGATAYAGAEITPDSVVEIIALAHRNGGVAAARAALAPFGATIALAPAPRGAAFRITLPDSAESQPADHRARAIAARTAPDRKESVR